MRAVKDLPTNYILLSTLNLSEKKVVIYLNLAAIPLLFVFGYLFIFVINLQRSYSLSKAGIIEYFTSFSFWELIAILLSIIFMLVLHELIHGIFFYLFTRQQPSFALKSGYAFAAAPGWYLPCSKYIIVGLSPILVISFVAIILSWVISPSLIPYLLLIATCNAAGSLGDLIVIGWVLQQSATTYILDEGDIFYCFVPENE
jgi:Putative zincin peptidase